MSYLDHFALKAAPFSKEIEDADLWLPSSKTALVDDLVVEYSGRSAHVLNAVSPGLTCSLPFAEHVVEEILKRG